MPPKMKTGATKVTSADPITERSQHPPASAHLNKYLQLGAGVFDRLIAARKAEQRYHPAPEASFSPFSLQRALLPLFLGTAGQSQEEVGNLLFGGNFTSSGAKMEESSPDHLSKLAMESAELITNLKRNSVCDFTGVLVSNAAGGGQGSSQKGEIVGSDYKGLLKQLGAQLISFASPAQGIQLVNELVKKNTKGAIPQLLDPKAQPFGGQEEDPTTLMILNTLYFKAGWEFDFPLRKTNLGEEFKRLDGSSAEVALMRLGKEYLYYQETEFAQYVRLRYSCKRSKSVRGDVLGAAPDISLVIQLPKKQQVAPSFEEMFKATHPTTNNNQKNKEAKTSSEGSKPLASPFLAPERWDKSTKVRLELPRFTIESKFSLKEALQDLGLRSVFKRDGGADFSPMSNGVNKQKDKSEKQQRDPTPSYIADVIQQVVFAVDEEGTSASAATLIPKKAACKEPREEYIDFTCNRTFGFMLVHDPSQTPLFMGVFDGGKTNYASSDVEDEEDFSECSTENGEEVEDGSEINHRHKRSRSGSDQGVISKKTKKGMHSEDLRIRNL